MSVQKKAGRQRWHCHARTVGTIAAVAALAGCTASAPNASGVAAVTQDPERKGLVSGVGIESQDIVAMSNQMVHDMLGDPRFAARIAKSVARPRIVIDSEYFSNESSQPINRNLITQRLLVGLNQAAGDKLVFVNRAQQAMVAEERERKRSGATDTGTTGLRKAALGVDYRLSGRIGSLDSRSAASGMVQSYVQVSFEMTDLESGELVWTGLYEFSRAAADDVVYR